MMTIINDDEQKINTNTEKDLYKWIDVHNEEILISKTNIKNIHEMIRDIDRRLHRLEGRRR